MLTENKIQIPYKFKPRPYQMSLFRAIDNGYKRGVCVWHRRAGKDKALINLVVKKALERVGAYFYYFPTAALGRKIIWQGRDRDGFPFLDHIPKEIRAKTREDEMRVELINGSAIQIVGTDKFEVVGPNPVGCVFSEFAIQNPRAWNYIRPILAENDGWAVFNFTPRGYNHGWDLYQMALDNEDWFCELLTVDDTQAVTQEAIDAERRAGMSEELIQQEFFCSFAYGLEGAYYTKQINKAREEGRITNVPIENVPVHTAWDLGMKDSTAIWFYQLVGLEIRLIDYYENSGEELAHYAKVLQDKDYLYGDHFAPHDIEKRELGSGISLRERAREVGIDFQVLPQQNDVMAGIEAVRSIFPRCWFDKTRAKPGLNCLINYRKEWDEKHHVFKTRPLHDFASDAADAFRYLAIAVKEYQSGSSMSQEEADRLYEQYAPPVV